MVLPVGRSRDSIARCAVGSRGGGQQRRVAGSQVTQTIVSWLSAFDYGCKRDADCSYQLQGETWSRLKLLMHHNPQTLQDKTATLRHERQEECDGRRYAWAFT